MNEKPNADNVTAFLDSLQSVFGALPTFYTGSVWIVGAGSRHAYQASLEAIHAIAHADIILHDALIPHDLLHLANKGAQVISYGKRAKNHSATQQEICQHLVLAAQSNLRVVRLKGGDPCIFSRLADEIDALTLAKIPYRILPGLSSVQSAAAHLGIPLTHRELSRALLFCSGYMGVNGPSLSISWQDVNISHSTLVLFMAGDVLRTVGQHLLSHGRNPEQPVAAISCMGMPYETVTFAHLANIDDLCDRRRPAIYIIGDVVAFSPYYRKWRSVEPTLKNPSKPSARIPHAL